MTNPFDRRHFLKLSALAAAPMAIPVAARASSGDPIVIIGAGLAGLRAAALLRAAGRRVLVLEARERPGGRVHTIRGGFADGLYGEAGPIRIAGVHRAVLRSVRDHGLTLAPFVPADGASLISVHGVGLRSGDALDALHLDLHPAERGLSPSALLDHYVGALPDGFADPDAPADAYAAWRDYDRLSWPDWLKSRGASAGAVTLMTLGGDSDDLSALYVLRQYALHRGIGRYFKIQGGMDLLPRAMAASLESVVRYSAPVVRIDRNSGLRVDYAERGATRSLKASRIVLTVPFSTLRQIEIRAPFSAAKERVIADLQYFAGTRFLVQSRSRFWRQAGLNGSARTDRPAEVWDSTYDLPGTAGILGVNAGGAIGRALLTQSADQCVAFGTGLVADAFPDIRRNFTTGIVYRWAAEPWSRGAFATFRPGQMAAMMPEISRPEGGVHFAGEHTSSFMGWMEGALRSGERVAAEILEGNQD